LIESLLSFAVLAGLLTLVPGIDTTLVLRTAIARGSKEAFVALCGIATGVLVWGVAAAVGISALLLMSETAFLVVKYAGAAYLLYLGIQLIRFSKTHGESDIEIKPQPLTKAFLKGLTTNILNPKVGVFYMAVLPQFIWSGAPTWFAGIMLALVHVTEGMIWLSIIIFATSFARNYLARPKTKMWIDRIAGSALIGFGLKTALDH
jgi:RhtB (resistance to homoserine/threonine) family protein